MGKEDVVHIRGQRTANIGHHQWAGRPGNMERLLESVYTREVGKTGRR